MDVYETFILNDLKPGPTEGTFDDLLAHYTARVALFFARDPEDLRPADALATFKDIASHFQDMTDVPVSQDATLPHLPEGCVVKQVLFYSDQENVIYRNPELWNSLSNFDRVALVLHEGLYKAARGIPPQHDPTLTSDSTRRITGKMMSSEIIHPLLEAIFGSQKLLSGLFSGDGLKGYCVMYATEETRLGEPGVGLYFVELNSDLVAGPTSAFFPRETLQSFGSSPHLRALLVEKETGLSRNIQIETLPFFGGTRTSMKIWNEGETPSVESFGFWEETSHPW